MSEELRETIEILRIGSDFLIKLGGISKESLQALFAAGYSRRMTQAGKVDFKTVMKSCSDRGCSPVPLSFPSEDKEMLERAEKMLKKMDVQFSRMPDFIQGDGQTQYLVAADNAHFFNIVAKKLYENELERVKANGGQIKIESDSCKFLEGDEYSKLVPKDAFEEAKEDIASFEKREGKSFSPSKRIEQDQKKLKQSNRNDQTKNDPDCKRISIDKESLLKDVSDEHIFFKIPGTKGKEFAKFRKSEIVAEDDKMLVFNVNKKEAFSVYDNTGRRTGNYTGNDFLKHFNDARRTARGMSLEKNIQRQQAENRANRGTNIKSKKGR